MCQVDDEGISLLEKKPNFSSRDCMKCGDKAVVIARIKDAFCRSCFLTYFMHRFRATFGKAKVIRDGDQVLLAFSGGQCSSAMVSLVKRGLDQSTHKKLRFIPALIYIDEGVVTGQSKEERAMTCQRISAVMKGTGFPWYIAALEEALEIPAQSSVPSADQAGCSFHSNQSLSTDELAGKLEGLCMETELTQRCRDLLASAKSLTAKQDLVSNLRNRLLVHKARHLGYHRVVVSDSGTRLSAGVLANLAKGRGASIPDAMAFSDERCQDVTILRPMREFTTKEIVMYNTLFNVDSLFQPTLATMAGDYASIDTLTESFINELQANFPSTVSTVFRTGEKMCRAEPDDLNAVKRCSMCMSTLDTSVGKSSALSATKFSLQLSRKDPGSTNENSCKATNPDDATCTNSSSEQCCGQGDGSCHSNQMKSVSAESLNKTLCYGCQVTSRDVKDLNLLPSYILEESAKNERRTRMREEIQDFLLCEES